ncbi:collagen alpha-2(I) chain-like [Rhipicephalus sanguineus]|uniref:collagen alpha-2(I) chain-like n=1 Tax=Rhipicephalus sanguineus TaxID=34632 RepID=UPI0020C5405B|nr:collagen alpha-2(I) chain-like [Rhipicephalus sanguineus]
MEVKPDALQPHSHLGEAASFGRGSRSQTGLETACSEPAASFELALAAVVERAPSPRASAAATPEAGLTGEMRMEEATSREEPLPTYRRLRAIAAAVCSALTWCERRRQPNAPHQPGACRASTCGGFLSVELRLPSDAAAMVGRGGLRVSSWPDSGDEPGAKPSPGAALPTNSNAEEQNELFGIEGGREIETRSADTAAKKQADSIHGAPKAGRAKRQAAAADNAAGPSNEAPAAKRPRGRPPKAVSVEPLAPKPIATTVGRVFGIEGWREINPDPTPCQGTSTITCAKGTGGGQSRCAKGGRAKRQAAAADNAAGPSNEAPAAKRPRGRPPKAVSVEPLAPKPIETTVGRVFGIEGWREIKTPSTDTVSKEQAEANHGAPKAGRAKRQAAAADNAAGPSNEAPAAKRPRGRPPKAVSVEPLAPKPIATTVGRVFGIEGWREIKTPSTDTVLKEQAEANHGAPKAGRAKRQAAAADNAAGPSNEAPAAKRPRGRPPKAVSVEPLAPEAHRDDDPECRVSKEQAEAIHGAPKAGRAKRQAAAANNAAGPSNEAPAAKRPRGRPPKAVSVEPLAPKPIATTVGRVFGIEAWREIKTRSAECRRNRRRPSTVRQRPGERSARLLLLTMPLALPSRLRLPSGRAVDRARPCQWSR